MHGATIMLTHSWWVKLNLNLLCFCPGCEFTIGGGGGNVCFMPRGGGGGVSYSDPQGKQILFGLGNEKSSLLRTRELSLLRTEKKHSPPPCI